MRPDDSYSYSYEGPRHISPDQYDDLAADLGRTVGRLLTAQAECERLMLRVAELEAMMCEQQPTKGDTR